MCRPRLPLAEYVRRCAETRVPAECSNRQAATHPDLFKSASTYKYTDSSATHTSLFRHRSPSERTLKKALVTKASESAPPCRSSWVVCPQLQASKVQQTRRTDKETKINPPAFDTREGNILGTKAVVNGGISLASTHCYSSPADILLLVRAVYPCHLALSIRFVPNI